MLKKIFALEQSRFIVVGIMNTIIGTSTMFIAYSVFHLGYWVSMAKFIFITTFFSIFRGISLTVCLRFYF